MSTWYTSPTAIPLSTKLSSNSQYSQSIISILSDDDLTKQILKLNQQITKFISFHPILTHQLIQLITTMPIPSDTEDRKFKYPMLVCDVLTRNEDVLGSIADLKDSKELNTCFELLFKLFEDRSTLNSILPGYFQRVFQLLCKPRFYNKLIKYLFENTTVVQKMTGFSESLSIVKCVLFLVAVDSKEDYEITEIGKWVEFKKGVLRMCIKEVEKTKDELVIENILVEVLKELVDRQQFIYHKRDLVPILFENESVNVYIAIGVNKPEMRYQVLLLLNTLYSNLIKSVEDEIPAYFLLFLTHLTKQLPKLFNLIKWKSCLETNEALESLLLLLKLRHILPCKFITQLPYNVFEKVWNLIANSLDSNILHNKFQKLIQIVVDHGYDPLIKHCFSNFNMVEHILNYCLEKPTCSGFLIRVIESWVKQENYSMMQPYLKDNKVKMDQFTKGDKLFKYLKNCRLELGKMMDVPEQKDIPQFTVKKFIIEHKVEPAIEGNCLEFGTGFELNFQLNDPPSVLAPDAGEISMDNLSIPFNSSDGLSQLSLQKNLSTTSSQSQSIPDSVSSKLTKQVSFQEFMKSKRETITSEIQQKSKTPSKQNKRQGSRSASKKKVNKWGNNNNQNLEPSSLVSSKTSQISVNESQDASKIKNQKQITSVYLPKVNIYQIPAHRIKISKTMPQKERKLSPTRDVKMFKILKAMKEQGQLIQV